MVRNRKRTTDRASIPRDVIDEAVKAVSRKELSYSKAVEKYGIPLRSLQRYCKKASTVGGDSPLTFGYVPPRKIFSCEEEKDLIEYVNRVSDVNFGVTPKEVRKFAYQFAVSLNRKVPESWEKNQHAGEDWCSNFLKRNSSLSIRRSDPTSVSRATSFKETNVVAFFKLLRQYYEKYSIGPADTWYMDETGISPVQNLDRVVTRREFKQIGKMTSAESETLVTLAVTVSASGNMIPPVFIFPRENFEDDFLNGAPIGSIGCSNPSGWMKEEHFILFAKHFVRYTNSTQEKPTLLLLDNHDSYLSITALNYLKANGVEVLSFPPHCSHKLQPLDRSVHGPLKKYVNTACDSWYWNNPFKTMTICDIPGILATVLPMAATESNIRAGFAMSGISPLNPEIFPASELLPSFVMDRPEPITHSSPSGAVCVSMISKDPHETSSTKKESELNGTPPPVSTSISMVQSHSPLEDLWCLSKAGPRQGTGKGRKKRPTAMVAHTPVKIEIHAEKEVVAKRNRKQL